MQKREDGKTAIERFDERFEHERAEHMTTAEWGKWLDSLPEDEFLAMIEHYGQRPVHH